MKFKIDIEDEGVGITEENKDKIFIEFGKLDQHANMNF